MEIGWSADAKKYLTKSEFDLGVDENYWPIFIPNNNWDMLA